MRPSAERTKRGCEQRRNERGLPGHETGQARAETPQKVSRPLVFLTSSFLLLLLAILLLLLLLLIEFTSLGDPFPRSVASPQPGPRSLLNFSPFRLGPFPSDRTGPIPSFSLTRRDAVAALAARNLLVDRAAPMTQTKRFQTGPLRQPTQLFLSVFLPLLEPEGLLRERIGRTKLSHRCRGQWAVAHKDSLGIRWANVCSRRWRKGIHRIRRGKDRFGQCRANERKGSYPSLESLVQSKTNAHAAEAQKERAHSGAQTMRNGSYALISDCGGGMR